MKAIIIVRHSNREDTVFVKEVPSNEYVSDVLCGLGDAVAICPCTGEFYGWDYDPHDGGYYTYHKAANASDLQWAREFIA